VRHAPAFHSGAPPATPAAVANTVDDDTSRAEIIDDLEGKSSATIMSTFDVQSKPQRFSDSVNPEVKLKAVLEITRNLAAATDLPKCCQSARQLVQIFIPGRSRVRRVERLQHGALIPRRSATAAATSRLDPASAARSSIR